MFDWKRTGDRNYCPECDEFKGDGHLAGCSLAGSLPGEQLDPRTVALNASGVQPIYWCYNCMQPAGRTIARSGETCQHCGSCGQVWRAGEPEWTDEHLR